jgi:glutaconyl-CoA/methylmalonyl-CoA decarboxylase subunit gamma
MSSMQFYKILINDQLYEVEIVDLQARPVLAVVNGTPIEVWPEHREAQDQSGAALPAGETESLGDSQVQALKAPMPGTIISVAVKDGAQVAYGKEICVLEAMKMKNSIRSPRAGTISKVLVVTGQLVKHNDILVEFKR